MLASILLWLAPWFGWQHDSFAALFEEALARHAESGDWSELAHIVVQAHELDRSDLLKRAQGQLHGPADVWLANAVGVLRADGADASVPDEDWTWTMLEVVGTAIEIGRIEVAREFNALARRRESIVDPQAFLAALYEGKIAEHDLDLTSVVEAIDELRAIVARDRLEPFTLEAWASLANLEFAIGDYAACESRWADVVAAAVRDGNGEAEFMARADRCDYHRLRMRYADWSADAERLVELCATAGLQNVDVSRFRAYYQRASCRRRLKDLDGARTDYDIALRHASSDPSLRRFVAAACDGLALVALERGDLERSRALLAEALIIEREHSDALYLLDTLQTLVALELKVGAADAARAAADEARALLESPGLFGVGPRASTSRRARFASWSELEQDLAALELASAVDDAGRERAIVHGLEAVTRWTGRSLSLSIGVSAPSAESLIASLRAHLANDTLFVHFADGRESVRAYVLGDDVLHLVELGSRIELEGSAARFREEVLETGAASRVGDVGLRAHALFARLLEPIVAHAAPDQRRLLVVTTAGLGTLPLEALVTSAPAADATTFGELAFVIDQWSVAMLPSALLVPHLGRTSAAAPIGDVQLFGDPTFAPLDGARPEALPWSRTEVLSIADTLLPETGADRDTFEGLMRLSPSGSASAEARTANALEAAVPASRARSITLAFECGVALHLGEAATPARVLALEGRFGALHFATHTRVTGDDPSSVGLVLAPDPSGDAVLDLVEIRSMRVRADLVVLSACSTATGPLVRGDGAQSLASAFFELGSRAVVASICPVADDDACRLLCDFHARRRSASSPSQALRDAKLALRRATESTPPSAPLRFGIGGRSSAPVGLPPGHPRTWATFVYIGN
jgi:CHAT domain-containing protein/tetratricopeptide (TPR) repeat protein